MTAARYEGKTTVNVQHLDPQRFLQAYGVDLQVLYPWEGVVEPPFGAAWAILAPGQSTKSHQHQEGETFFVARGEGEMTVDGETVPVRAGSVVFQDPFHEHTLTNTSATEDLMFLTVWWEDRSLWAKKEEKEAAAPAPRRVMVTAAPPTPNGDLHLGHLAGPYLCADFHTRYLRLRGVDAFYACGSDDHSMYVERMGEKLGMTGPEAAAHLVAAIEETLGMAGIAMDVFMHPDASARFEPLVLEFFDRLWRAGKLEAREGPSPYCERCERYLFEADVAGRCPHCGAGVTGNTCESCGGVNDSIDLVEARCTQCGAAPAARRFRRLIFPLSRYGDALGAYLRRTTMNARLRSFCERLIADGLPDVAVSHVSDWGIRVPLEDPDFAGQTLYVWFEMAARYFAYAEHVNEVSGAAAEGYSRFWRSGDASIVQFFGVDNNFYYALLLPALYLAFDAELRLPAAFVTNEFYRLDGQKFSTSRGHAILGRALLAEAPRDAVRFYLAHTCPEHEETSFTRADFEATVERELVWGWQRWLTELAAKVAAECGGTVPATGDWTSEQRWFYRRLEQTVAEAAEAYEAATFSPQRLTRLLSELVRTARRFGKAEDCWRLVPQRGQERRTGLALELLAAKVLAILASPVMPDFAARLWRGLGYEQPLRPGSWEPSPAWVPVGQRLGELGGEYFRTVNGSNDRLAAAAVPS
ncbi:MAG TPA: class I tRNA ligase family protein [Thermoanaerobaculia bacterium]